VSFPYGPSPASGTQTAARTATSASRFVPGLPRFGHPDLTPAVAGTWSSLPDDIRTTLAARHPSSSEWCRFRGPRGNKGQGRGNLPAGTPSLHVADGDTLRLQELLAELDYCPCRSLRSRGSAPAARRMPQFGSFALALAQLPAPSRRCGRRRANVITKAAVMTFENQERAGGRRAGRALVWSTLLADVAADKVDTAPLRLRSGLKSSRNLTLYTTARPVHEHPGHTGAPEPTRRTTYPSSNTHLLGHEGDEPRLAHLRRSRRAGQLFQRWRPCMACARQYGFPRATAAWK